MTNLKELTTWNNAIRKSWDISTMTHKRFIEPLSGCKHVLSILFDRFLKFQKRCMEDRYNDVIKAFYKVLYV